VQFTVRYWTTHTFAAYDAKGRLVAGDPNHLLPVRSGASFPGITALPAPAGRAFAAGSVGRCAAAPACWYASARQVHRAQQPMPVSDA